MNWSFIIILFLILAAILALLILTGIRLRAIFGKRYEENPKLYYKTVQDFPDMAAKPVSFFSGKNRLSGAFYHTLPPEQCTGLILFLHGLGAGHHSYMTEIHTLAQAGFLVFSYDNTACAASEGKRIRSFYQGVRDLDAALRFLAADESKREVPIALAGHSWGAYVACQALALPLAYRIQAIVSLSAFNRPQQLAAAQITGKGALPRWLLYPFVCLHLLFADGLAGIRSCADVLRHSMTPALLLHGTADSVVSLHDSVAAVPALLAEPQLSIRIEEDRAHNLYQSARSEQYLNETFSAILAAETDAQKQRADAAKTPNTLYAQIDYDLITEEDPDIMNEIICFLRKNMRG